MIAKLNLENFKAEINEYRKTNISKMTNAKTNDEKAYYSIRGLGFEHALSIFLKHATFVIDDKDEVQE